MQVFFSLLTSIALNYDPYTVSERGTNIDALLSVLTMLPVALAIYLESPLVDAVNMFVVNMFAKPGDQAAELKKRAAVVSSSSVAIEMSSSSN